MSAANLSRSLLWFRRDLRLHDQRAFYEATLASAEVLPVFVIDETIVADLPKDDRRIHFLQECLDELDEGLRAHGSRLLVVSGDPVVLIPELAKRYQVTSVYTNHDYEPSAKARDAKVAKALAAEKIELRTFKDQVVFERREILNGSKEPYKVFTPYSNNWVKAVEVNKKTLLKSFDPDFKKLMPITGITGKSAKFSDLGFKGGESEYKGGEKAARKRLKDFADHIAQYGNTRDFPAVDGTSSLSVYFRFGLVSIREAVRFCYEHFSAGTKIWLKELIWREFYMMILDQYPHVVNESFRAEYAKLKWPGKKEHFEAWREGRTGYPLVDAAMRQLNTTGWMHNRLRMVTAMFLTKDLLIDWRLGERYFALKLMDYELASNNGGWQWSSSTGCDSQPYFRIMNPISQSEKFDGDGDFIRRFVPELKKLSAKQIHWPHDEDGLFSTGLNGYPEPIVDHKTQRQKALALFKK